MEFYPTLLLFSLIATSLAGLGAVLSRVGVLGRRWIGWVSFVAAGGALLAVVSIVGHVSWGHTPGSADALELLAFVANHPAPLVSLLFSGLALYLVRRAPSDAD